ncbi:MAG: AraC family transcriptional regulator [Bacillota bacterium]|jgi:AraC-like DNA-binding protein
MKITFFSKESWEVTRFHFHDELEILLILSEGNHFFIGNTIYPLKRGSLFVLNNTDLHRSVAKEKSLYQFYSVRFFPEEISGISTNTFNLLGCFENHDNFNHRVQLNGDQLEHLLKMINKAEYYLSADCSAYGKEIFIKIQLAEILVYVNFLYKSSLRPLPPKEKDITKIIPIIKYIRENATKNLNLDILAQKFYISKYHLCHNFKKNMGFTINEYIISRRLMEAKTLLRKGYNVSTTAEKTGFNSTAHFIRTFKKFEHISPKQYAKQFQIYINS